AVTWHVLKRGFQLGQPFLGQSNTGAQLGRGLDRSGEWVDTRRLGGVHAMIAIFLTAREPTGDCASEYCLAARCQPRCLPQRECRHVTSSVLGVFKRGHAMRHGTPPVTLRTRWLTIGEGGHVVATAERCSSARTH